jgi:cell envelope opacity-associated protein A
LGGAVYLLRKYLAARKAKLSTAAPVDPYEQLLSDMLALQVKSPFTSQVAKEFYFQLSYYIKLGVELTQGLRATDLTTKEVAARLKVAESDQVISLLQLADMVKFAEREASAAEALDNKAAAINLVRALKPKPVAPLPTDMLAKVE